MPELPEVETILCGITPYIVGQRIENITLRHTQLRWPIPQELKTILPGVDFIAATRRGKYLLLQTRQGTLIIHLGMSGRLCIVPTSLSASKHDHFDISFSHQKTLRFTDPRRFGAILWTPHDPKVHPLLCHLGPEPLTTAFTARYLAQHAINRSTPIKNFIMDSRIVVGVGNIYATEALFTAKIHPQKQAGELSLHAHTALVKAIKNVLRAAIRQGGTTLKDFANSEGKPGYFKLYLKAYGRKGLPCLNCTTPLVDSRLAQRATVYCTVCQV